MTSTAIHSAHVKQNKWTDVKTINRDSQWQQHSPSSQTDRQTDRDHQQQVLLGPPDHTVWNGANNTFHHCQMFQVVMSLHTSLSYFQFHSQLANLANVSIHRQSVDYMHTSGGEIFRLCTSWTSVTWTLDPVIQHMYHSCTSMYTSNFGKTLWMDGHWDRL